MTKNQYVYTKTTKRQTLDNDDGTQTEQFAITLSPEQAQDLADQLANVAQTNGELGARVVFYTNMRENSNTGEKFPATSILVQAKSLQQGSRNGFARGGGARRQYPTQQSAPPRTQGQWGQRQAPSQRPGGAKAQQVSGATSKPLPQAARDSNDLEI